MSIESICEKHARMYCECFLSEPKNFTEILQTVLDEVRYYNKTQSLDVCKLVSSGIKSFNCKSHKTSYNSLENYCRLNDYDIKDVVGRVVNCSDKLTLDMMLNAISTNAGKQNVPETLSRKILEIMYAAKKPNGLYISETGYFHKHKQGNGLKSIDFAVEVDGINYMCTEKTQFGEGGSQDSSRIELTKFSKVKPKEYESKPVRIVCLANGTHYTQEKIDEITSSADCNAWYVGDLTGFLCKLNGITPPNKPKDIETSTLDFLFG